MNEDKIFDLITTMYSEMKEGFKRVDNIDKRLANVENEVSQIKKTVIKIENEHGHKLEALFDGYKQNTEQLNRIESEVSRHEEVILKRVK